MRKHLPDNNISFKFSVPLKQNVLPPLLGHWLVRMATIFLNVTFNSRKENINYSFSITTETVVWRILKKYYVCKKFSWLPIWDWEYGDYTSWRAKFLPIRKVWAFRFCGVLAGSYQFCLSKISRMSSHSSLIQLPFLSFLAQQNIKFYEMNNRLRRSVLTCCLLPVR